MYSHLNEVAPAGAPTVGGWPLNEPKLARIGQHQSDAVTARITVFEALARAGASPAQEDELVSHLEAEAVAGAHTWVSESSPPASTEQAFASGWFKGVRAAASDLLRIADTTAARRSRVQRPADRPVHRTVAHYPGTRPLGKDDHTYLCGLAVCQLCRCAGGSSSPSRSSSRSAGLFSYSGPKGGTRPTR